MAKRVLQLSLIDDKLDNPTANAADRLIDLSQQLKKTKELYDVQERNLLGLLKKMKKIQVKHRGVLIKVKYTESKEKISMKVPKTVKKEGKKNEN